MPAGRIGVWVLAREGGRKAFRLASPGNGVVCSDFLAQFSGRFSRNLAEPLSPAFVTGIVLDRDQKDTPRRWEGERCRQRGPSVTHWYRRQRLGPATAPRDN